MIKSINVDKTLKLFGGWIYRVIKKDGLNYVSVDLRNWVLLFESPCTIWTALCWCILCAGRMCTSATTQLRLPESVAEGLKHVGMLIIYFNICVCVFVGMGNKTAVRFRPPSPEVRVVYKKIMIKYHLVPSVLFRFSLDRLSHNSSFLSSAERKYSVPIVGHFEQQIWKWPIEVVLLSLYCVTESGPIVTKSRLVCKFWTAVPHWISWKPVKQFNRRYCVTNGWTWSPYQVFTFSCKERLKSGRLPRTLACIRGNILLDSTRKKLAPSGMWYSIRFLRNIASVYQSKLRHILADHNLSIQAIADPPASSCCPQSTQGSLFGRPLTRRTARYSFCSAPCPVGNTARESASVNTNYQNSLYSGW